MSTLAKLLPKILPSLKVEPSDEQNVFDYSTPEDFSKLWKFEGLPVDRILIIWARTASDPDLAPINAADCLSPLDWAAAYVKKLAVDPVKWPEILILDVSPEAHRKVPTLAHFHTLRPDQLPWLTVSSSPSLNDILEWCAKPKPSSEFQAAYNAHCETALVRFLREIRLNLTEVRTKGDFDRHSISNIISPMILLNLKELQIKGKSSFHAFALMRLMHSCGLAKPKKFELPESLKNAEPSILLVDDQSDHGWMQWLSTVFPSSAKSNKLRSSKDPRSLLVTLKDQWDQKPGKDLRFEFSLPGLEKAKCPLLFLDLRLFAGNWKEELQFYTDLISFISENKDYFCVREGAGEITAESATTNDQGQPGHGLEENDVQATWAQIPETLIGVLTAWIANSPQPESPQHLEAMLLLPKVIALADMALPIVLFSSTSKRDLVAPLADYKNIYLGFHKDVIRSGTEQNPIDYLRSIMPEVRAYGQWRNRFEELSKVATIQQSEKKFCHWEVYIDESGTPEGNHFRVAGLLVGYETSEQAQQIHTKMEKLGLRWRYNNDAVEWIEYQTKWLGKPRNGDPEGTNLLNDQWNSISAKLEDITKGLPKYSFCILREYGSLQGDHTTPKLLDSANLDNLFFSLLNDLLEACLFDVLPAVMSSDIDPSIKVFAGARRRSLNNAAPPDQTLHEWINVNREAYAAFGVALNNDGRNPVYEALTANGILPIVAELLEKRRSSEVAKKLIKGIDCAAAIPMGRFDWRNPTGEAKFEDTAGYTFLKSPPFRHLHFVADIMASLSSEIPDQPLNLARNHYRVLTHSSFGFGNNGENKGLFARREGEDQGVTCLLRISRLLDPQDKNVLSAAWLFQMINLTTGKLLEVGLFARSVLLRLKEALENDLTGLQLNQLIVSGFDKDSLSLADKVSEARKELGKIEFEIRNARRNQLGPGGNPQSGRERGNTIRNNPLQQSSSTDQGSCRSATLVDPPKCLSDEKYAELKERWRIRLFEGWHEKKENGYRVRRAKSGKIWVFADITVVNEEDLEGFRFPEKTSFKSNGDLLGDDWRH